MARRTTAPSEIRELDAEQSVGAGSTVKLIDEKIPANSTAIVTGLGQGFGAAGTFVSTILWSILINGAGAESWHRFYLQRGSFTEPANPQIHLPPGARVTVLLENGSGGAVDAQALLRLNISVKVGVRAGDIVAAQSGDDGSDTGEAGTVSTTPISGGGGSTVTRDSEGELEGADNGNGGTGGPLVE